MPTPHIGVRVTPPPFACLTPGHPAIAGTGERNG